jgi:Sulfotransferase domain
MGQSASLPGPGVNVQVIGCGMSRTGTTSFCQALEILLGGPVYHGGTQVVSLYCSILSGMSGRVTDVVVGSHG